MPMMRWEPLSDLGAMARQLERLMEQVSGRGGLGLPHLESATPFIPSVEISTTEKEVILSAELPGIAPEDVEVEISEDMVHICGEMKRETEIQEDMYYRSERQFGHFDRQVPLPERIRAEDAKATFKNGLLTVHAPLAQEIQKRKAHKLQIQQ